jgi:uncharacterized protein YjbI with pentapeptide repeats
MDSSQLLEVLAQFRPGSDVDARGTVLSESLLSQILDPLRHRPDTSPIFGTASFDRATFIGHAKFDGAVFDGAAGFAGATFTEDADFGKARFLGGAGLTGDSPTEFVGSVRSTDTTQTAIKANSEVNAATFSRATFKRNARFHNVGIKGLSYFTGVTFTGDADFDESWFFGDADFTGATFTGDTRFHQVIFTSPVKFDRATFEAATRLGPLVAYHLSLRYAVFSQQRQQLVIEVATTTLDSCETRFEGGVNLRLRYAWANMERAVFVKPSAIAAAAVSFTNRLTDEDAALAKARWPRAKPEPTLISLRGVDVAELVLTDLDMSQCTFAGAHHLDKLRLEGACQFGPLRQDRPSAWWWTRRQVLAEERAWRDLPKAARRIHRWRADDPSNNTVPIEAPVQGQSIADWLTSRVRETDTSRNAAQLARPRRIADLYRQLRKALEDSKNEPGAADFYYGEMEMRRRDATAAVNERFILHLYWMVSGYGLRALRALACLAVLITVVAFGFQRAGFAAGAHPAFGDCLLYVAQSTVSLETKLASLPKDLTWQGEAMRLATRVAGPLLLGLALLAVRNRVKR